MRLDSSANEFRLESKYRQIDLPLPSDGDESRKPDVDEDESWESCPHNSDASIRWRGMVGFIIVCGLCAGNDWADPDKVWHVSKWPDGYSMWRKARKNAPTRFDYYLYGGPTGRFSSPIEAALHMFFLFSPDEHSRPGGCRCNRCTRRTQGEVNRAELDYAVLKQVNDTGPKHGSASTNRAKPIGPRHHPSNPGGTSDFQARGIVTALRNHYFAQRSRVQSVLKARDQTIESFRIGELVWLSIPVILHSNKPDLNIRFWPCVIKGVDHPTGASASSQGSSYQIDLLGVNHLHVCHRRALLPYSAYRWHPALLSELRSTRSAVGAGGTIEEMKDFHPLHSQGDSKSAPKSYQDAIAPLAAASWAVDALVDNLILVDPWEKKFIERDGRSAARYQGCWVGPEMLWEGDLVRLHLSWLELARAPQMHLDLKHPNVDKRGILVKIGYFKQIDGKCLINGTIHGLISDKGGIITTDVPYPIEAPRDFKFLDVTRSKSSNLALEVFAGRYYSQGFMKEPLKHAQSPKEVDRMNRLWLPLPGKQGAPARQRTAQVEGSRLAFVDNILKQTQEGNLGEMMVCDA